jgi:hypothetical protein
VSPKSFVRQVRIALARETDAFRPATYGVRSRNFAGQVAAALARAPIVVVPQPGQSADDLVPAPPPLQQRAVDGAEGV